MPLVSMAQMLARGKREGYAVCYCESWNLESLQAVIEAAEELGSPVIAGFNGGFLNDPARSRPENLAYYAGMGLAAHESSVPVALLLNETDDLSQIELGIRLGFNAVMVESHHLGQVEYLDLVKRVVDRAHPRNVAVEAQIGRLRAGCGGPDSDAQITDPIQARAFVEATCVDALSVSIGNVHILTEGKATIDLDALRRVHAEVEVPLVVHGGSGFPPEYAPEVIRLGVAKFNFGTVLKQSFLVAIRDKLATYTEPMNPHLFVGMGGEQDILMAGREAVKLKVKELIQTYGFAGKSRNIFNGHESSAEGVRQ